MCIKHGMSGTVEYKAWSDLKDRCLRPKNKRWSCYGGRNIRVSEKWLNDFECFLQDVGYRPSRWHSISRINNDLGYLPGNVRWDTRFFQSRNKQKPIKTIRML